MNPIPLLTRAVRLAGLLPTMEYALAAVGVRRDGAVVHSSNKAVRTPGPAAPRIWGTHAELRLCRKLDAGATVFVARILRDGTWANAKPCSLCMNRLRSQRVRRVFYTTGPASYGVLSLYQ